MDTLTWCVRIKEGHLDEWAAFNAVISGPRKAEMDDQRRRMGFRRHVQSLMKRPEGDYIVNFVESDDFEAGFRLIAFSDHPFDVWFRSQVESFFGTTQEMLASAPPAVCHLNWVADERVA